MREHKREFWCNECDPQSEKAMSPSAMKEHLRAVHNISESKGNRSLEMALDGDFYSNTFTWTLAASDGKQIKLTEIQSGPK